VATQYYGHPYTSAFSHPYYYGGRPTNVYFGGGYSDYSFGYYGHPYYAWMPWSPVYYYNPPIYANGGYVTGGFSFLHLLFGIVFWVVVIAVVFAVIRHFRNRQSY
jgi:hypothetical protein